MIIIPMAGLSSRFSKAGYSQPKYMLPLNGRTVFTHSVSSFSNYFQTESFVFIARNIADTENFIFSETTNMGIKDVRIIILEKETSGQAETIELGIQKANLDLQTSLTIFNIDTFRKEFIFPDTSWFSTSDGYLEVFRGVGENWSYVEPSNINSEPVVLRTAEKQPISDLCCDGLYHFKKASDFLYALFQERYSPSSQELYVAPLYNHLIKKGKKIHYYTIPKKKIIFCGVPLEYTELLNEYGK